ncbi:MAG: arsenite methyltransferase [Firmicutes bacterium]|jgi:arsenite methyltransferase|nr:arsenite methyltransferase [Bacillota bacterium]
MMSHEQVGKKGILDTYRRIARGEQRSCCGSGCSCHGGEEQGELTVAERARQLGYTADDLSKLPQGVNLGLGCGNPLVLISLKEGETVLDLGSGAGIDCFLARQKVGPSGKVIGVDMTPEMVFRARETARQQGYDNVEFRLGEIEHLPVGDGSVDVVISNCVINLSPEKERVFKEIYRVLRAGGRLSISDIVALKPLPKELKDDSAMLSGCVVGASSVDELRELLHTVGFQAVQMQFPDNSGEIVDSWSPYPLSDYVSSCLIQAVKPKEPRSCCSSLDCC